MAGVTSLRVLGATQRALGLALWVISHPQSLLPSEFCTLDSLLEGVSWQPDNLIANCDRPHESQ